MPLYTRGLTEGLTAFARLIQTGMPCWQQAMLLQAQAEETTFEKARHA